MRLPSRMAPDQARHTGVDMHDGTAGEVQGSHLPDVTGL